MENGRLFFSLLGSHSDSSGMWYDWVSRRGRGAGQRMECFNGLKRRTSVAIQNEISKNFFNRSAAVAEL